MTAIFLVWNYAGLAVAADQSVSVTTTKDDGTRETLWTETENKIFALKNEKVAIASSGSSTINTIPINGVLAQWENSCAPNFPHLEDYVHNFISWLCRTDLHTEFASNFSTVVRMDRLCQAFSAEISERQNEDPWTIVEQLINEWDSTEPQNLLGPDLMKYLKTYEWTDRDRPLFSKFVARFQLSPLALEKINQTVADVEKQFEISFEKAFGHPLDRSIIWHAKLKEQAVSYFLNCIDGQEPHRMSLMFVGYGTDDWIPQAVILDLYDYDQPMPKIVIRRVTNPEWVWYETIGQDAQFSTFLTGVDEIIETNVTEVIREHLGEIDPEQPFSIPARVNRAFDDGRSSRVSTMRAKISLLSPSKLEFVAKQFVQIESLASFLQENLPSVGGDIDTITLTR